MFAIVHAKVLILRHNLKNVFGNTCKSVPQYEVRILCVRLSLQLWTVHCEFIIFCANKTKIQKHFEFLADRDAFVGKIRQKSANPTSTAYRHLLDSIRYLVQVYSFGRRTRRCFAVAGPSTWNSLPDSLREPALFAKYWRDVAYLAH